MTYNFSNDRFSNPELYKPRGNTMSTPVIETNQSVDRYIETPHHFYASSFCTWKTGADMREVLAHMEKEGYEYTLWYVPADEANNYQIKYYAPQVEGSFVLGTFTPKKKSRK